MITTIAIVLAAIAIAGLVFGLISRYKRCKPDQLMVISGKTGGSNESAKIIHGGAAFVIPVFQQHEYLNLKPLVIDVDLREALSKQNIRIDVPSTVTVGISPDRDVRVKAAEKLLGLSRDAIKALALDIIYGQMRLVIATMDIEEINTDRDAFLLAIKKNLVDELAKIGLLLVNVNVKDIKDESGYIEALGKKAAAQAINEAKVDVAEKNKIGSIGQAEQDKDRDIQVAQATSQSEIGQAEADKNKRVETSNANAKAVEGENIALVNIANSNSAKQVAEAEAKRAADAAATVKAAAANKEGYEAQTIAETERAKRDKASQYASVVVPAEIAKDKLVIESQAIAEQTRETAKGEADAIFAKAEAEAKGIEAVLTAQAEGFTQIIKSAGNNPAIAVQMMMVDKIETLTKLQMEAVKGIDIDKITVWDNSGGDGNGSSTSGLVGDLLKSAPQLNEIMGLADAGLPEWMLKMIPTDTNDSSQNDDEVATDSPDAPSA